LKYRKDGKEMRLALGSYPTVSLAIARIKQSEAKALKHKGIDPVHAKLVEKLKVARQADDTFESTAREWYSKQINNWSTVHAKTVMRRMERDLFPWIGKLPMAQITAMELLAALQKIEARQAIETAHRVLDITRQVWTYWLPMTDVKQRNITDGLKARLQPYRGKNFAAILEPKRVGEMMRAIKHYKGGPFVRVALQITPIVYQRPGNIRMMEWSELDLSAATWTIPSAKMKRSVKEKVNGEAHVIPLPNQVVALLKSVQPISGHERYVFPSQRSHDRPMSDNAVRSALYALGFGEEQKPHAFRAVARTLLVDELGLDPLMIEANLAHGSRDRFGRSYNRTQYIKQRFEMIQKWADYLDFLAANYELSRSKEMQ
jgi:integrase